MSLRSRCLASSNIMKRDLGLLERFCLLFLFGFNVVACLNTEPEDASEVVFTSIIYRHGERTPISFSPNDPYKGASYWPEGKGWLTNNGKLQQFELGKWLRTRYMSLIPGGKYSDQVIYIQSTDVDRALMSAEANLAGMFYPTQTEMWSNLEWQPIPVHTVPEPLDKLISVHHPCPRINYEKKVVAHSPEVKAYNQDHKKIYKYLTTQTGESTHEPSKVRHLYISLLIEKLRNLTLPSWTEGYFPDVLYPIASYSFKIETNTETLKRLKGGPLLKDIISHMKQKRDGTLVPSRNLWVYSAHDTTLAALMNTMGVFDPHPPPFAATVLVELRRNKEDEYFASVLYKNTTTEPHKLTIPGCSTSCPLDKFESLLKHVIPDNWDEECQAV